MMEHHGDLQSLLDVKRDPVFRTSSRHVRKTHSIPFEEFFLKTLPVHVRTREGRMSEGGKKGVRESERRRKMQEFL